ncbi:Tn3 family transposase [Solidesulfovibrio magneticus]|uniref:Transposase n=1 Tax=Solidesulfovibrio magneticus (strain ATCC 700980 / DSM 13731 / RS-1) TaxID=573370 RepID=C4XUM2_SOLM1|nr:Tn3 family transposase [Solidesulfovibrio magneticus]BAH73473.1 transposase [Solidesulfovibrio magneticus RS-1]
MPRRSLLTPAERATLLAFPTTDDELIRHYTLSEADLSVIRQRRGNHNRLGFAVQLCYLRYPGFALPSEAEPPASLLNIIGSQLYIEPDIWPQYAQRPETRREHLLELQAWLNLAPFAAADYRHLVQQLAELAKQTDRGIVLAEALVDLLRQQCIILPALDVIDRVCSEALTRGTRQVYEALTTPLTDHHRRALDALLAIREGSKSSGLIWLRQPPGAPKPKHVLAHLERLKTLRELGLPDGLEHAVHQNRLLKLAREGGQMTAQHLRDLEPARRYATLVAVLLDTRATLIDEIIDLHDRFIGSLFGKAKRKHADRFQESAKAINDKMRLYSRIGRALLDAKLSGDDPFAAIEAIMPWEAFTESITEAERLAQPEEFDYLALVGDGFNQFRRYTPTLLDALNLKAAPAARDLLEAVEVLKDMNSRQARKVPDDAPTSFVRKRWENLVHTSDGLDRRYYELCVLSELKNSLRSGDIWVQGSRQFKDFEDYLLPPARFSAQRDQLELGLAVETDCNRYLESRLIVLQEQLDTVERLAAAHELPDAAITSSGRLKISPLNNAVPDHAEALMQQAYSLLPHLKITELLLEVDGWTGFTRHFKHLKSGATADDKHLLLTAVLADAINLGLSKMAESCPGTTYAKLTWLQAWHIRDETYSAGLAELVNAQFRQPFAAYWGDGTTSSSDGQNYKAGGRGQFAGQVNLKYGQEPGVQFYTHISDQYAPFHTKIINATVRDATHVLDGLLYHESDLRIEEHYTDTAGFTDHVFALMQLLGFRFAPRIRDLADKRLYIHGDAKQYPTLAGLIGGSVNIKHVRAHWDEILRLAASIKQGTVTASLMLRKLGSYPRQNGLAVALREFGRIERTLFALNWMQNIELRRRVQIGLNKGEAKNALARAVFMNRLGEIRDRSFQNQRYRASGLNLVVTAIILWNTVYLERAIHLLRDTSQAIDEKLLPHLSPLGWEHINLTGDYIWRQHKLIEQGKFRPLRMLAEA